MAKQKRYEPRVRAPAGGNFCGSELLHTQRPNGSPISSLRLAAGSKSLAT
jgi:hypothetical protein